MAEPRPHDQHCADCDLAEFSGITYAAAHQPPKAASRSPLEPIEVLKKAADEALAAWDADKDSRVGKLLASMAGRLPGYRADIDAVLAASRSPRAPLEPDLLEAAKALRIDANRLCDRMLGGSYEADCRLAIKRFDAALAASRAAVPQATADPLDAAPGLAEFVSTLADHIIESHGCCSHDWLVSEAKDIKRMLAALPGAAGAAPLEENRDHERSADRNAGRPEILPDLPDGTGDDAHVSVHDAAVLPDLQDGRSAAALHPQLAAGSVPREPAPDLEVLLKQWDEEQAILARLGPHSEHHYNKGATDYLAKCIRDLRASRAGARVRPEQEK